MKSIKFYLAGFIVCVIMVMVARFFTFFNDVRFGQMMLYCLVVLLAFAIADSITNEMDEDDADRSSCDKSKRK